MVEWVIIGQWRVAWRRQAITGTIANLSIGPFWNKLQYILSQKIFNHENALTSILFRSRGVAYMCYVACVLTSASKTLAPLSATEHGDVIMTTMASQITSLTVVYSSRSKKTSKLRVTVLCTGNSPGTGEFTAQVASNAENVSIWWRHHQWFLWCCSSLNMLSYERSNCFWSHHGAQVTAMQWKQDCFLQKEARVCVSNAFVLEDSMFK